MKDKKEKARERAKAWRLANPERYKAAIAKCKAANPEKYAELQRKWWESHPDYATQQSRKWNARNPGKTNEYSANWRARNPERRKAIALAWNKRNQDKVNAVYARRRAMKLKACPKWANDFFIKEIYHLARLRTKMLGYPWHVDHIVPLQSDKVCGLHVEHNLQVIPSSVNQSKNNRSWPGMA